MKIRIKVLSVKYLCVCLLCTVFALQNETVKAEYIENEYAVQKTECSRKWKSCFLDCMNSYGIDFYNPPKFNFWGTTYQKLCNSQCTNEYDCNATYNWLKGKGKIN